MFFKGNTKACVHLQEKKNKVQDKKTSSLMIKMCHLAASVPSASPEFFMFTGYLSTLLNLISCCIIQELLIKYPWDRGGDAPRNVHRCH